MPICPPRLVSPPTGHSGSITLWLGIEWRRRSGVGELLCDALAEIRRHGDASQLRLQRREHAVLEAILRGAGGAGLEVRADECRFVLGKLAIEILIHAAKGFFAGVAI